MNIRTILALLAVACLLVVAGVVALSLPRGPATKINSGNPSAPPLIVIDAAPLGLIGTVVALGANTVTVQGQPPGNKEPVSITVSIDKATSLYKVGPAPSYATSSVSFADLKLGMTLNVTVAAAVGGVRHADRVIIPPPAL